MEGMQQPEPEGRRGGYRSLFWPLVLVGVGVIWLLANMGVISVVNLAVLVKLWPLLLIVIGLDLLFGRRSPVLGALIGLAAVAAVIVILINAPALGLSSDEPVSFFGLPVRVGGAADLKHEHFSEPIGEATSAHVRLDLAQWPTTVKALSDSSDLIDADVYTFSDMELAVSGGREKSVELREVDQVQIGWIGGFDDRHRWQIGLTPDVPMALEIDSGSGRATLDLSELQLTGLYVDSGSGHIELSLPATGELYDVEIGSGSGSVTINIPDGAMVNLQVDSGSGHVALNIGEGAEVSLEIDSGSGSVAVDVPDNAAVRVEVQDSGSGALNLPGEMDKVRDGDDEDEGVWETPGFEDAAKQITITVAGMGSGSVEVR